MNLERRTAALAFFIRMGWTPAQSAGIVANLEAESGLRPDAVGDGGAAYGIAQWHAPRQANFAGLMGKQIQGSSFEDQLAFVDAELQGEEKAAGDALRSCATAEEAGRIVSLKYERPADREGEAAKRAALAAQILASAPQIAADIPTPQPEPETPPAPEFGPVLTFGGKMLPLLLPAAIQLIPQLIAIFGKGGERAQQNAQAAQAVADAVVKVTGAPNLQGGIEAMQADPSVKAAATAAVLQAPAVAALLETSESGGGGIAGARKAAADPNAPPLYRQGPFWITLILLLLVGAVVSDVLFFHPDNWTSSDRSQILILAGGIINLVAGYWIGSSLNSQRKTELMTQNANPQA